MINRLSVSSLLRFAVCLWPLAGAFTAAAEVAPEDSATQSLMHAVLKPLSQLLPFTFDDQAFESEANRPQVSRDLKELMESTAHLQAHGRTKDRVFEFIAQSLRNDARHAYQWYGEGNYDESRFILHNITENCVACHANLPETHKVPPPAAFFAALRADRLSPLEKAQFYVVSRQFDDAMQTYEDYFKSTQVTPGSFTLLGAFTDYLKVAANAKADLKRPQRLISQILTRVDLPANVRSQLATWNDALLRLDAGGDLMRTDLAAARTIFAEGHKRMEFPRDRDGLIHYLVAAAILNRYVHAHPDRGADVGEAYYMLGVTESLLARSFWISREEFDFESAIRLAPGAAYAPKAFNLLEETYTVGFSGSGGTHVPPDVKALLAELHSLIDAAHQPKT